MLDDCKIFNRSMKVVTHSSKWLTIRRRNGSLQDLFIRCFHLGLQLGATVQDWCVFACISVFQTVVVFKVLDSKLALELKWFSAPSKSAWIFTGHRYNNSLIALRLGSDSCFCPPPLSWFS